MHLDQNNVWVSREEYDRLRQQAGHSVADPTASYAHGQDDDPPKVRRTQIAIGVILAIGLFLSMTNSLFKFVAIPVLLILLIFAAMSLNDFRKAKQLHMQSTTGELPVDAPRQNSASGKYKTLLVILVCTLAMPVVVVGGFIVVMLIMFSINGGPSS